MKYDNSYFHTINYGSSMQLFNPLQPNRPEEAEDGNLLHYRTHISKNKTNYGVYLWKNMLAQANLYRWCLSVDFDQGVPIRDLHAYLFFDQPEISKWSMGSTVAQATMYLPNRLKGKTRSNPKAQSIYIWRYREEFQYGLEWMLSMWIWSFEQTWDQVMEMSPEEQKNMTSKILEEIGALEDDDYYSLYVDPIVNSEFADNSRFLKEPDWPTLIGQLDETDEDRFRRYAEKAVRPSRPKSVI